MTKKPSPKKKKKSAVSDGPNEIGMIVGDAPLGQKSLPVDPKAGTTAETCSATGFVVA